MVAETPTSNAIASYPPRNSLEAALSSQRNESMANVNGLNQEQQPDATGQETCNQDEAEAMRVRGGCIPLDACGCPNVECCCIPCTIS